MRKKMTDYRKMYYKLFGALVNITEELIRLQRECEELYISSGEEDESKTESLGLILFQTDAEEK